MNPTQIDILLYIYFQEKPYLNNLVSQFPASKADIDFVINKYCYVSGKNEVRLKSNYEVLKVNKDKPKGKNNYLYIHFLDGDLILYSKKDKQVSLLKRKYTDLTVYLLCNKLTIYNVNEKLKDYIIKADSKIDLEENTVYFATITSVYKKTVTIAIGQALGRCNDLDVEVNKLLLQSNIITSFSSIALKDCKEACASISYDMREDLTPLTTFTIDNDDTKDIDDALSIVETKDEYLLYVHIADVTEFVREKTTIDQEASKRCFSLYLPTKTIPMLPAILCEDFCSLNTSGEKLAITSQFTISKRGKVVTGFKVYKSIIKVNKNLSYSVVDKVFVGASHELANNLISLFTCYQLISKLPLFSKMLSFTDRELKYNQKKNQVVVTTDNSVSSKIIEKIMVLTNYYIACFLEENKLSFPYRVQEKPSLEKLVKCNNLLKQMALPLFGDTDKTIRRTYQQILGLKGSTLQKLLFSELLLQTQTRASYSLSAKDHYALKVSPYTHFTAPIRRYEDILVHRQVKSVLEQKRSVSLLTLKALVSQINIQEQVISRIERKTQLILATLFYQVKPQKHKAIIANSNTKGFYIKLETGVLGFVPINTLSSFYLYNSETGEFYNDQSSYRVGDEIIVDFIAPNYLDLYLDFTIHYETNY